MNKQSELKDLYAYAESQFVIHPIKGRIPYKLFPYQRAILKAIHENDNLVVVKGRQIGMTTLLAVYTSWLSNRQPLLYCYNGINRYTSADFKQRLKQFNPKRSSKSRTAFRLCIHDEINYRTRAIEIPTFENRKNVLCGSVDEHGVMKKFIKDKNHSNWKVLSFPVSKCKGSWDAKRVRVVRKQYDAATWAREFECKFV